ncbi:hypothetical protein AM587_10003183 [Phytophthora nicotianae]|uniref:Capsid protein n=1 Tax=Phytophthora nicotianae TaxID=4792 RepID=A0A0W8CTE0_PHYNI|nr:hypothetical protein AM587_10003183 [Phytophthora nicotianae]
MSTASDISAFEHSVEPAPAETLFRDKKWTYIQDSTSNTGQYAGQIQFNLSTISSQAAFVNWQEAVIELPIKLQILNVVVDGVTVQTNQVHENVNATFKALTEWDYNYYLKNASTSLFTLDEYEQFANNAPQALDNVAATDFMTSTSNVGEFGLANTVVNKGARDRAAFATVDQSAAASLCRPCGCYCCQWTNFGAHYLACVKLADICDYFKKCPMQKNTRGFIYVNYNSSTTQITTTNAGGVLTPAKITSIYNNMNFDANGTPTQGTNITPSQAFSRLLVPTYSPNPSADNALIQKKTFRYFERSFTWTVSNGIANPKKLILQPIITNPVSNTANSTNAAYADVINPFRSPLSTIPATTSPFAALKNLQVTVGNIPIWNNPVSFGYDLFVQEMSKSGVDGGLDDVTTAGLLNQRLWESLYRFVAVDTGRRLPSEDGAQKSIVISGTSNCDYALTIYYHVWREVVATVDTAMGTVSQGAVQH